MRGGTTLVDKIWDRHVIDEGPGERYLLHVDRHFIHDGSAQSFERLDLEGRIVRSPARTTGTADHYVSTDLGSATGDDEEARGMVVALAANAKRFHITNFGAGHPQQGIVHVVGPELGLTLPGMLIICGDSHTSTHGAMGAFAFGVGASEVAHVLATQTIWQSRPKTMRITINGVLPPNVTAKDLILHIIAKIGTGGATGHAVEYAGEAVTALSMEGRLTLCNMSIEAGARAGIIAPDAKTFAYVAQRPMAPKGALLDQAIADWSTLKSAEDAVFDREIAIDAARVERMVTWGTSPEDAIAVTGNVPGPDDEPDPGRRARRTRALEYMGLDAGMPMSQVRVDRVFIGSCANGRIEDLRAAAAILRGRRAIVPTLVVPGSGSVKAAAEAEGLDRIFKDAGAQWRDPGCSMCVAINGADVVPPGERCASTSNRNFVGRQGRGARTHLMSPALAAAAAVTGHITDVSDLANVPTSVMHGESQ